MMMSWVWESQADQAEPTSFTSSLSIVFLSYCFEQRANHCCCCVVIYIYIFFPLFYWGLCSLLYYLSCTEAQSYRGRRDGKNRERPKTCPYYSPTFWFFAPAVLYKYLWCIGSCWTESRNKRTLDFESVLVTRNPIKHSVARASGLDDVIIMAF